MEIVICKQTDARQTDADAEVVRRYLFQAMDGATDRDKKAWRDWWRAVAQAGSGEFFSITIKRRRNGKFHRLSFVLLQAVFKAQERFDDFRIFRAFVKLGANYCDFIPTPDGEIRAVPKSTSFSDCSEEEMREFHTNAIAFLRTGRAQSMLWPHMPPALAEQGMEKILSSFDRSPS